MKNRSELSFTHIFKSFIQHFVEALSVTGSDLLKDFSEHTLPLGHFLPCRSQDAITQMFFQVPGHGISGLSYPDHLHHIERLAFRPQ